METYDPYDILFGVNDVWHFVHEAECHRHDNVPLKKFFELTEKKRKWSLVNPGSMLIVAYAYFVYGQEKKLLNDFPSTDEEKEKFIKSFTVKGKSYEKCTSNKEKSNIIKRRLRNSLAHCRYSVEARAKYGYFADGDIWYVFKDHKTDGSDKITMKISVTSFGNIIEAAGKFSFRKLKSR